MKTTRKRYSAAFEAKPVVDALGGDLTLAELATKRGVPHRMIAAWTRQALDGMVDVFGGSAAAARTNSAAEVERLPARIGHLVVERDFRQGLRSLRVDRRRSMIEPAHPSLSIAARCRRHVDQPFVLLLRAATRTR